MSGAWQSLMSRRRYHKARWPAQDHVVCAIDLISQQWVGQGSLVGHDQAMGLTVLPIEVRDQLAGAELNYREVGATAGNLPAGYHQFTRSLPIGDGHELFVTAGDAVRQWQVQLGAGLQVSASSPTAVTGTCCERVSQDLDLVQAPRVARPDPVSRAIRGTYRAGSSVSLPNSHAAPRSGDVSGRRSPKFHLSAGATTVA
jgi:Domain of unknown function (DUF1990)